MQKADNKPHQSPEELIRFVENLKRQWVSTIDALTDPLMIVNSDFKIQKANKALAKMAGKDVKELIGQPCYQTFADRNKPCTGCQLQKHLTNNESGSFELENIREDRFFEVSSQPLFETDGSLMGAVHVYRDRTHAKRLQEQLMQQEKLASIGLLAGGVAHEINNPLGGILIFSQMLLKEMDPKSSHYQDVVEIEQATQRCKAIVESLLDFARQQPHRRQENAQVNVIEALQTALRLGKVSSQKHQIHVVDDMERNLAHLAGGDRNKFIQLFLNLIQNALQAMPDGGDLTISATSRVEGDTTFGVYEIKDTGIGIAPEHLKKVFDPFFTTKEPGEGTGLGLALCYGFVQELKGQMSCSSKPNVGTNFKVEIPLKEIKSDQESA